MSQETIAKQAIQKFASAVARSKSPDKQLATIAGSNMITKSTIDLSNQLTTVLLHWQCNANIANNTVQIAILNERNDYYFWRLTQLTFGVITTCEIIELLIADQSYPSRTSRPIYVP
jgi:hypothetical protein